MKMFVLCVAVFCGVGHAASQPSERKGVHVVNDSGQVLWLSLYGQNHKTWDRDSFFLYPIEIHEIPTNESRFVQFSPALREELIFLKVTFNWLGLSYRCVKAIASSDVVELSTKQLYEMTVSKDYEWWPKASVVCHVNEVQVKCD